MICIYRHLIEGSFTPDTLPMARLAVYLAALAELLGERGHVHFQRIEAGSTVFVANIDPIAEPKIQERVEAVRDDRAAKDAMQAFARLDELHRQDNARGRGTLSGATGDIVIPFPGRERPKALILGPLRQDGTLTGQLIRIGGRNETTVPVHLRDGDTILTKLNCTQELARKIAQYLFGPALRVHGTGEWKRTDAGAWELENFKIADFAVLEDTPLLTVVENLRKVKGSQWRQVQDPVRTLLEERHGDGDAH